MKTIEVIQPFGLPFGRMSVRGEILKLSDPVADSLHLLGMVKMVKPRPEVADTDPRNRETKIIPQNERKGTVTAAESSSVVVAGWNGAAAFLDNIRLATDVVKAIRSGELTPGQLAEIRIAEESGKGRKVILAALESV